MSSPKVHRPDDQPPGEEWRAYVPLAKDKLAFLERDPGLLPDDRVALVVQLVARHVETFLYPKKGPVRTSDMNCCILVGTRAVAEALEYPEPRWAWASVIGNECEDWHFRFAGMKRRVRNGTASAHDELVYRYYFAIHKKHGPRRDVEQFDRAMKSALAQINEGTSPEDVARAQAEFRQITFGEGGFMFVGKDGKVRLGHRQVRDRMRKAHGARRKGRKRKGQPAEVELKVTLASEASEATTAVDRLERAETDQALRAHVREWAAAQLRPAIRSKVRRLVFSNLEALVFKDLSLRAVAKMGKHSPGAVHQEWKKVIAAMRRDLGRSLPLDLDS
jgi:hypothetical protein